MNDDSARTVLEAKNVGMTFPAGPALRNFEITVRAGRVRALVGENGSGKSTFVKILSGYHTPDPGSHITVDGQDLSFGNARAAYEVGCRFVHQDLALINELSIADNLSLSTGFPTRSGTIRTRQLWSTVRDALDRTGLRLDPNMPVGLLSPANKTGVAIARALRDDGEHRTRVLVMDEPTATLPDGDVRHLLEVLRSVANTGVAVLYVSHRLEEVFSLCDEVTVLRDGTKVGTRRVAELTRPALITLMVGEQFLDVERTLAGQHQTTLHDVPASASAPSLAVESFSSDELRDVSLFAQPGSITGIAGITGSGRESLLSTIFGGTRRDAGQVSVNGAPVAKATPRGSIRAGIGYLPPDRKALGAMLDQTARENLTIVRLKPFQRLQTILRTPEAAEVRRWFEQLRVRPAAAFGKTFGAFSGGNQQKILFAKWMRTEPAVLLLDEPTQGVDVGAKALLHEQTIKYAAAGGTVVVSSSDTEELLTLCERVLVMRNGRIVAALRGAELTAGEIARHALGASDEAPAAS